MKKNFTFYFVGICGISMSSIAILLKMLNFNVLGSDINLTENYTNLKIKKIFVFNEHNKNNIKKDYIVIYNSAISLDNQELNFALKNNLCFSRVEFICLLKQFFKISVGISGCHGKTTTTGILLNLLKNEEIYVNIGGLDSNFNNFYFSGNNIFLTEVCEYKKNINLIKTDIAVVLNIDFDHLECYKNKNELINSYYSYLDRSKYKVINIDDINLKKYKNKNVITFGLTNNADYFAKNIKIKNGIICFDLYYKKIFKYKVVFKGICKHNVYNVLSSICVCNILNIPDITLKNNLLKFNGIKRRCEFLGECFTNKVYADYAHHPTEILSTINSFKKVFGKKNMLVIFQPHTYSRTKLLFKDFIKVLEQYNVKIFKTYPARENENCGYNSTFLSDKLKVEHLETKKDIIKVLKNSHNKIIVFMGAGDLYFVVKNIMS